MNVEYTHFRERESNLAVHLLGISALDYLVMEGFIVSVIGSYKNHCTTGTKLFMV